MVSAGLGARFAWLASGSFLDECPVLAGLLFKAANESGCSDFGRCTNPSDDGVGRFKPALDGGVTFSLLF